jgi:PAS domain S-box-containing protein
MKPDAIPDVNMQGHHIRLHRYSVAAALIVPVLLFAVVAWQDYKSIMRSTEQDVERTTEIFRRHAMNMFETHQLAAEAVNVRIKGMSWDDIERSPEIHLYLQSLQAKYPQIQSIWLADATGLVRNASLPQPASPVNVSDRDYFSALRQADVGTLVGHVLRGRLTNKFNFNVVRRREGKSKAFDGIVAVSVFPEYFSNFWNKILPKEDAAVAMIRSDGYVLARAPRLDPNLLQLPPTAAALQAFRIADEGSYRGQSAHDKIQRFYTFSKVGGYNAYIVNGISVRAALKEWKEDLLIYGALFGCATAALVLLAVAALRRAGQEQVAVRHWQETAGELAAKSAELQATAQRLRLATSSGRLGIWEWDIPSNTLVWDEQMFELYGVPLTTQKVTLATWENSLHPEDRDHAKSEVQVTIEGERQLSSEFRVVLPDGGVRHIKANGLVVKDAAGNAVRMIGINSDITVRKRLEAELAQHRESLEELVRQRTAALDVTIKELHGEIAERLKAEESLQESEETLRRLNAELDQRVRERTLELEKKYDELERVNKLFVGRELRMIELKDRIRELEGSNGTA